MLTAALLGSTAAACNRQDVVLGKLGGSGDVADGGALAPGSGTGGTSGPPVVAPMDPDAAAPGAGDAQTGSVEPPTGGTTAGSAGAAAGAAAPRAPRPSTGCGTDAAPSDLRIEVDGQSTSYLLDLPEPYDPARAHALVLAFRRNGDTAQAFRASLDFARSTAGEALVVYPNCLGDMPSWEPPRDLPLFDALLSELEARYCIDRNRVFVVGLGGGSLMANAVGCLRGDLLRAIAPLTGIIPPSSCPHETAVLLMQSDAESRTLGYGRSNRDFWVAQNGCDEGMTVPVAPAPCVAYSGCRSGVPVRYCENSPDLDVTSVGASTVWSFFDEL